MVVKKQAIYFDSMYRQSDIRNEVTKYHMMEPNFECSDIMVIRNSIFLKNKIFMSIRFMIIFNLVEKNNEFIVFDGIQIQIFQTKAIKLEQTVPIFRLSSETDRRNNLIADFNKSTLNVMLYIQLQVFISTFLGNTVLILKLTEIFLYKRSVFKHMTFS